MINFAWPYICPKNAWAEQITKLAFNLVWKNNFNNCVVVVIQLFAFVCKEQQLFFTGWPTDRRYFCKSVQPKARLTDYYIPYNLQFQYKYAKIKISKCCGSNFLSYYF